MGQAEKMGQADRPFKSGGATKITPMKMRAVSILCTLAVAAGAALRVRPVFPAAYTNTYDEWKASFNPLHEGTPEAFAANVKAINEHNARGTDSWTMAVNQVRVVASGGRSRVGLGAQIWTPRFERAPVCFVCRVRPAWRARARNRTRTGLQCVMCHRVRPCGACGGGLGA